MNSLQGASELQKIRAQMNCQPRSTLLNSFEKVKHLIDSIESHSELEILMSYEKFNNEINNLVNQKQVKLLKDGEFVSQKLSGERERVDPASPSADSEIFLEEIDAAVGTVGRLNFLTHLQLVEVMQLDADLLQDSNNSEKLEMCGVAAGGRPNTIYLTDILNGRVNRLDIENGNFHEVEFSLFIFCNPHYLILSDNDI